jgi:hypothetical protein
MIINEFYVYAYIRNKDSITAKAGTPYYIGKGKGKRMFSDKHNNVPIPKDKQYIVILESGLTEIGALALERRMIRWWGKRSDAGILLNKLDGGDGATGLKHTEETKRRIAEAVRNRPPRSDEYRKNISKGQQNRPPISEETRKRYSEAQLRRPKGQKRSPEVRARMTLAQQNRHANGWAFSEESRNKMSESQIKRFNEHPLSEESRKKISNALKGKIVSGETRQKLSDATSNFYDNLREQGIIIKRDPITEETRKKMSERAMNMSNEHREKLSIAAKKRPPMSDEIKRKISETKRNKTKEGII